MDGQMTTIPSEVLYSSLPGSSVQSRIAFLSFVIVLYKGFVFMQKE